MERRIQVKKITFIGAGSFGFTRTLVKDLLTFPALADATICLMDIHEGRLKYIEQAVRRIISKGNYPATVEATMDRVQALKGADGVCITILSGETDVWRHDIEIPKKYGVDINVGDTRGPSGIFRFMRTASAMLDIAKDIEKHCPNAVVLNYTNPMAMLIRYIKSKVDINITGLCHSVQGTAHMLADWIGADMRDVTYLCAGINHQAHYLDFKWKGQDAYPLIREAMKKPEIYNHEQVRNDMFLAMDYYITESSGHNSEYVSWYRKRPDLIEKYCTHGTGWNPGEYAYILKLYQESENTWEQTIKEWLAEPDVDLARGEEYAAYIFNAIFGDNEAFEFNGNVRNNHIIDNLPLGCCVEVPIIASKAGLRPLKVGNLPPQLAIMNNLSAQIEEMAVEGYAAANKQMIYQAICFDPLTSAVLSLEEIRRMVDEMFETNKAFLPQFM